MNFFFFGSAAKVKVRHWRHNGDTKDVPLQKSANCFECHHKVANVASQIL